MTPEEAYEEALRRIREAEMAEAPELDLGLFALNRLPPEFGRPHLARRLNLKRVLSSSAATFPRWLCRVASLSADFRKITAKNAFMEKSITGLGLRHRLTFCFGIRPMSNDFVRRTMEEVERLE